MASDYNDLERRLMAVGVIGIAVVGASVGGTISAIAEGRVGKIFSCNFSNQATHPEAVYCWKCDRCGYEWHKWND